jgi:NAD-dependent deacetylase
VAESGGGEATRAWEEAREAIRNRQGVVILTGAGVSAESGISTFRDPGDGLWARFRPEELATPEAFRRDPRTVWEWYDLRRRGVLECEPNPGHRAIARFLLGRDDAVLVTQNVDGLHQRALEDEAKARGHDSDEALRWAAERILPLHGEILRVRCSRCDHNAAHRDPVDSESKQTLPRCPRCGELLRPAVTWFGEILDQGILERSIDAASSARVCVVAGTSALVHPAASVPQFTLRSGGSLVEVNPEETPLSSRARWRFRAGAATALPRLLDP